MEYFGENCKTTPPSMFFPVFSRFIKAYKVRQQAAVPGEEFLFKGPNGSVQQQAELENQQRKQQKVLNLQAPTSPAKEDASGNKVNVRSDGQTCSRSGGHAEHARCSRSNCSRWT